MLIKKVKINHLNSGYWLAPKERYLIGPHNRDYIFKVFQSLEQLIITANLINQDICFNFNRDDDFKNFNLLQKMKGFNFRIEPKIFEKIFTQKTPHEWEVIPNLIIYLDFKSLKVLYKGIIPFYSKKYYEDLLKKSNPNFFINDKAYYEWTTMYGFVQKNKL